MWNNWEKNIYKLKLHDDAFAGAEKKNKKNKKKKMLIGILAWISETL